MDNKKIVKKYLIVIPARGGSKSVPKKNIKEFAGKPLICHTIDSLEKLKQHYFMETIKRYTSKFSIKLNLFKSNSGKY